MTREEKIAELERMLAKVPDVMSPLKASKCSPFGKNKIYELIKTKELRAFVFQGSYIIAKVDLIETIVDHSDRQGRTKDIAFQNKKRPKGIGEISDAFLDEKLFGNFQEIPKNLLCFSEKYVIIG